MRRFLGRCIVLLCFFEFPTTLVGDEDTSKIEFSISIYKENFLIYEPIQFKFKLRNTGEKDIYFNPDRRKISACLSVSFSKDGGKTYEVCHKPSEFVPFSLEGIPNGRARKISPGETFVIEDPRYLISPCYIYGSPTRHAFTAQGTYQVKASLAPRQDHALLFLEDKGRETDYIETSFASKPLDIKVEDHKMSDEERSMLEDNVIIGALGIWSGNKEEQEKVRTFLARFPASPYARYLSGLVSPHDSRSREQRMRDVLQGEKNTHSNAVTAWFIAKEIWADATMGHPQKTKQLLEWIKTVEKEFPEMDFNVKEGFEELKKKIGDDEQTTTPR